ncbi:MAG TPA: hypothetical protein PK720_02480 [bacterium]|nr:hypothetical protein [bacterium]
MKNLRIVLSLLFMTAMWISFNANGCNDAKKDTTMEAQTKKNTDPSVPSSSVSGNTNQQSSQRHQPPGLYWNELHQRGFNYGTSLSYLTDGITDAEFGAFYNADKTKLILFHKKHWFNELHWDSSKCLLGTTTSSEQMLFERVTIKSDANNYYVEVDPYADESGYIIWCYKQNGILEKYCPSENLLINRNTMVVPRYPKNPKLSSNFSIIEEKPWNDVYKELADALTNRNNQTAGNKEKK